MKNKFPHLFTAHGVLLAVLIVLCAIAAVLLTRDIYLLSHSGELRAMRSHHIRTPGIQSWMTFDYVNVIFKLPPAYLRTELHITDPRYPNIQISHYAARNRLNTAQFVGEIETAIHNYGNN